MLAGIKKSVCIRFEVQSPPPVSGISCSVANEFIRWRRNGSVEERLFLFNFVTILDIQFYCVSTLQIDLLNSLH